MPDITKIKIGNERERSYKDFPANREFKKRAEDDNPGGGGWPSDLPKPSVGGYGYTEQGEQTVITWDGDTEGRESYAGLVYKVSDNPISMTTIIGAKIEYSNGNTQNVTDGSVEGSDEMYTVTDGDMYVAVIVAHDIDLEDVSLTKGVYFAKTERGEYVSSLTYGTPDTIHKIDEKYLPQSGGAMVVVVDSDEDSGELVCNHTLSEIVQNFPNVIFCAYGNVGGNVWLIKDRYSGEVESVRAQLISADAADGSISGLNCYEYDISENSVTETVHSVSFI